MGDEAEQTWNDDEEPIRNPVRRSAPGHRWTVAGAPATPLDVVLSVDNASVNPGDVAWVRVLHASPDAPA